MGEAHVQDTVIASAATKEACMTHDVQTGTPLFGVAPSPEPTSPPAADAIVPRPRDRDRGAGRADPPASLDLDHDACYRAIVVRDPRFDGRLFTGVKTTGIYCRPICPARTPRSENVIFFPTAAAAHEAGFRPCLRCRPETSPDLGAWRGASNSVSRALALVEMGALDDGSVDALASRVGMGERQLRRLFQQHLGASPIAVAQSRRVLLAKQLIHETRLPMTEIAMAAGFGSLRRFNDTFQTLFKRPPTALRRSGGSDVSAGSRGEIRLLLRYRPPYDWPAMLGFLRTRAIAGVETVEGDIYRRTIGLDGRQGTVTVQPAGGHALSATVRFPKLSALPQIIARLRRVFDLAADPDAIAVQLIKDPTLAPLVAARPGLRVPGAWDGFELAVRAVLGQQITVPGAIRLAGALTARFGEKLRDPDGALTHVFPEPAVLAGVDPASLGMPRSRGAALLAIAAAVVADPHIFAAGRSLEEAVAQLRVLPGIGEWTAQYIAMRQLREPDAFPAADIGLMRAMADAAGLRPTASALLARAETWRPWRAYAAQHLWASA
jgi:AraC family transcriptional regulator, regulatory protein of adaptative response / DNA-3-methyladenine glycosylase II